MSLTKLACPVALGLLGAACRLGVVPPAPTALQPAATASPLAAPLAVPSLTAEQTPAMAAKASQPAPPAGGEEVASWLGGVCQLALVERERPEAAAFGCACCAPFEDCQPGSAGEVPTNVFAPSASVYGSFTRAGADELALTMPGCESHAENYGGLLLLERREVGFAMTRYVSGLNASACWAVRGDDGRDQLLCLRPDVHQGTADERLLLWDLSRTDEQLHASAEVFSVVDNSWSGCWSPVGTAVSAVHMGPLELRTRAGRVELTIPLDERAGRVTAAYLARCGALQQAEDAAAAQALPSPTALLSRSSARLTFRFDGTTFVPRR